MSHPPLPQVTKYQEQPQLLDPLLESVVGPLAQLLSQLARERSSVASNAAADAPAAGGEVLGRVGAVARLLWVVATVRGHKTVVRFFPNDVASFEPAVALLLALDAAAAGARPAGFDDPGSCWEAPCVLLLWLSVLVLVPFDISIIDSGATGPPGGPGDGDRASGCPPLVRTMLTLCQRHLGSPGSSREMAAAVLGRLLVRPDTVAARRQFLDWACATLQATMADSREGAFLVPGQHTVPPHL